jgi:hypothetical protein
VIEAVSDDLRAARLEVGAWRLRAGGWGAIEPGLRRAYARGRKARARADDDPSVENLHEWRKRAKDLWYHLRLLSPSAPIGMKGEVKQAHALTDALGDDHDLAVLRDRIGALAPEVAADLDPVLALIDHRRAELQNEARFLGLRVYAEKPRAFSRRVHAYWDAGREEAAAPAGAAAIPASARARGRRS